MSFIICIQVDLDIENLFFEAWSLFFEFCVEFTIFIHSIRIYWY